LSEYVVSMENIAAERDEGDTAETQLAFSSSNGCELLEQRIVRFGPGRSKPRALVGHQEVLYVASGSGTLEVDGTTHELDPDTAVYLVSGETYTVENGRAEPLTVVSVLTPQQGVPGTGRQVTVRFDEREEIEADENRTFRYLVHEDIGCLDVTQFLGLVKPCRAPVHSHPYDEVGYIVEGQGVAHVGGESTAIGPGSCFHLPPGETHCIENTGPGVMRILGVFYPSGSPKDRSYDEREEATNRRITSSQGQERKHEGGHR
jgi:mannose-6-phosphate isomerase-like protein (cupin superfamily)